MRRIQHRILWLFGRKYTTGIRPLRDVYDVVIAGGGLVGNALACACGSSHVLKEKHILLLEAGGKCEAVKATDAYSNRVSAISPGSLKFLQSFGGNSTSAPFVRHKPVKQLRVWEACSDAQIHFENKDLSDPVAHIIENNVIIAHLQHKLTKTNVQVHFRSALTSCSLPKAEADGLVSISTSDGMTLKAKLLVGADGASSVVRKTMGVRYVTWNYAQKGVVATVDIGEGIPNDVAWQRFTPTGPVALLPLTDRLSSLVWSTSTEEADRLVRLPDELFVDALNRILWDDAQQSGVANNILDVLSRVTDSIVPDAADVKQLPPTVLTILPDSRASFPLGFGHAANYVGYRVALVGDAAHRVHPLAGQGVNLGFRDVELLVSRLEQAVERGKDVGCISHLLEYESSRQRSNVPIMATLDLLNRLYSSELTPVVVMRSMGLNIINRLTTLKHLIMIEAAK